MWARKRARLAAWALCALTGVALSGCASYREGGSQTSSSLPSRGGTHFKHRVLYTVPAYYQRNPMWAEDRLGSSNESIGSAGCTLCCVSMLLSYYGLPADPKTLNSYLSENGGYTGTGLLVWDRCVDFSAGNVRIAYLGEPDYNLIDRNLLLGNPVIVKIRLSEKFTHWALVVGKEGKEYYAVDPLEPASIDYLSRLSRNMYALRIIEPAPALTAARP